jgi:hypothetical protein
VPAIPNQGSPDGADWPHEIKHGFRILARPHAAGVRLCTHNGDDFSKRFPLIVAVATLPARSCLIDGEAIVSDEAGLAVFDLIRSWRHGHAAVLCASGLARARRRGLAPAADRGTQTIAGLWARRPFRSLEAMGQDQEPGGAGGAARG